MFRNRIIALSELAMDFGLIAARMELPNFSDFVEPRRASFVGNAEPAGRRGMVRSSTANHPLSVLFELTIPLTPTAAIRATIAAMLRQYGPEVRRLDGPPGLGVATIATPKEIRRHLSIVTRVAVTKPALPIPMGGTVARRAAASFAQPMFPLSGELSGPCRPQPAEDPSPADDCGCELTSPR
jgi:hypothetical protein